MFRSFIAIYDPKTVFCELLLWKDFSEVFRLFSSTCLSGWAETWPTIGIDQQGYKYVSLLKSLDRYCQAFLAATWISWTTPCHETSLDPCGSYTCNLYHLSSCWTSLRIGLAKSGLDSDQIMPVHVNRVDGPNLWCERSWFSFCLFLN